VKDHLEIEDDLEGNIFPEGGAEMTKGYVYEHIVTPRDVTISEIVYDESYIEWACTARERMMIDYLDMTQVWPPSCFVGETYLQYMRPAYLNDRIEVRVTMGDHHVEKGYAKLDFRFVNKASGQLVAEGYQTIFFHDSQTGKRIPLPKDFMRLKTLGEE
jgi:acyl-CoA thioesterase FadM